MLRARSGPLERIGLQLYTVRDLMRADVARTLETVATAGYREASIRASHRYLRKLEL